MIKTLVTGALAMTLSFGFGAAAAADTNSDGADGKQVYLAKKCDNCHSVKSAGLEGKTKGATDLSGVSSKRKAEWLTAYLKKTEKIDGKAHPPKFAGTDAELKTLVEWLMALKPAS